MKIYINQKNETSYLTALTSERLAYKSDCNNSKFYFTINPILLIIMKLNAISG